MKLNSRLLILMVDFLIGVLSTRYDARVSSAAGLASNLKSRSQASHPMGTDHRQTRTLFKATVSILPHPRPFVAEYPIDTSDTP